MSQLQGGVLQKFRWLVRVIRESSHPLQLVLGWGIWALFFVALYGGLSVACAVQPPPTEAGAITVLNLSLFLLTLTVTAGLSLAGWACWRSSMSSPARQEGSAGFISRIAASLYLMAAFAAMAVGLPVVLLPACV
jgi:hypothetical protein